MNISSNKLRIFSKVIPAPGALVSINEREERDAQKAFYSKVENEMNRKRKTKLEFWKRVSTTYAPIFVLTFMTIYWIAGLKHAGVL